MRNEERPLREIHCSSFIIHHSAFIIILTMSKRKKAYSKTRIEHKPELIRPEESDSRFLEMFLINRDIHRREAKKALFAKNAIKAVLS